MCFFPPTLFLSALQVQQDNSRDDEQLIQKTKNSQKCRFIDKVRVYLPAFLLDTPTVLPVRPVVLVC